MTLAELLIGMVIMGLMTVVLAGMSNAVNSAWNYTKGVEITEQSAAAALERIKYMLTQTGAYRVTGQPTRLGRMFWSCGPAVATAAWRQPGHKLDCLSLANC
jgi:Tfp pilus assembly protein FimT